MHPLLGVQHLPGETVARGASTKQEGSIQPALICSRGHHLSCICCEPSDCEHSCRDLWDAAKWLDTAHAGSDIPKTAPAHNIHTWGSVASGLADASMGAHHYGERLTNAELASGCVLCILVLQSWTDEVLVPILPRCVLDLLPNSRQAPQVCRNACL